MTLDQLEAEHIRRILGMAATIEEAAQTLGHRPQHVVPEAEKVWDLVDL